MQPLRTCLIFVLAGLCEIGGGYLIWLWLRTGKSAWWAVPGAAVLFAYGVVATLQPSNFGRVYAAYGGVFIVLSILWGWGGWTVSGRTGSTWSAGRSAWRGRA